MADADWDQLEKLQLNKTAVNCVKTRFLSFGFRIFLPEAVYHRIDFVVKKDQQPCREIKVRSVRGLTYIFFQKRQFVLEENYFAAAVLFLKPPTPQVYLIPFTDWNAPNSLLVSYDYIGKESKPEWGINLSNKTMELLEQYEFESVIRGWGI